MRELQPCGTRAAWRRGCRCESCDQANRAYSRNRSLNRRPVVNDGSGICEMCPNPVQRQHRTGPVPRFCSTSCNTKSWKLRNPERYKAIVTRAQNKPEIKAKKRAQSLRRNQEQPLYFARLFWRRKARWVNYLGGKCPCGEYRLPCMEFDHRDPKTKLVNVSAMIRYAKRYTEAEVKAEVDKCDLLCANCHRLKTSARWKEIEHEFK